MQLGGGQRAGHERGGCATAMRVRVSVVDAAIGMGVAVTVVLGLRLASAHRERGKSAKRGECGLQEIESVR